MMYFTIMSSVTTRRKSSCHSHGETTRQFISPCGSLGEICQSWNYMEWRVQNWKCRTEDVGLRLKNEGNFVLNAILLFW